MQAPHDIGIIELSQGQIVLVGGPGQRHRHLAGKARQFRQHRGVRLDPLPSNLGESLGHIPIVCTLAEWPIIIGGTPNQRQISSM